MTPEELIKTLQDDWALEMDGVDMYDALAQRQSIPERKAIFKRLSAIEQGHADGWAKRLEALGAKPPATHGGHGHAVRLDESHEGMQAVILAIQEEERRDVVAYLKQLREIDDDETKGVLRQVVLDEFSHAHVLSRLYAESGDRSTLNFLISRQRQQTGSWIGDAIYGVNDGLGAIFGIVSGVSGATLGKSSVVLLAGVAGMIASALSMGSGAYLAAKSEREIYEAELIREQKAFEEHPDVAIEEMAIFYQLKGVPEEDAHRIAELLALHPSQFLRTMAAEKLNLTEDALSNPITSAITGSVSTAVGAIIPIIPFFFMSGLPAVIAAAIISMAAHFGVGAAKSLVTVRSWWSSGLEMTLVGAAEGIVTYVIGIGLGHLA